VTADEPWKRTEGVIARGPEIVIVTYESRWPAMFEAEQARIIAADYAQLKCEIVARIRSYAEYSPAKNEFIESVLIRARDERGQRS
jgi:GrpB-like predicted nucleotidyltransferase (UPF0157 family)